MSHFRVKQKDAFLVTSCRYDNRDNCRNNKEPESRVMYFIPDVRKLQTPWIHKESIFFYIYILKIYYDALSFDMSKLFVAPNRTAIEKTKGVLTFNLFQLLIFFFNRATKSCRHFCVRCTKLSEFQPLPTRFWTREKGTCSQDILIVQHDISNMFNTLHLFIPAKLTPVSDAFKLIYMHVNNY